MKRVVKIVTVIFLLAIIVALLIFPEDGYTYSTKEVEEERLSVIDPPDITPDLIVCEEIEIKSAPYEFLSLDDELQIYLEERCTEYDVDFFIMASLIYSESRFKKKALGDSGKSKGLCQVRDCWWDQMSRIGLDVDDPKDNIEIGLIIFSENLSKADGDYEKAIQYYKCGAKRGKRLWKEGKKLSSIQGILERADKWRNK